MLFLEPVGEGELSPDNFLNFLLRPSRLLEVNHKRPLTSTTLKGLGKNFKKVSDDNSVSPKVAKNTFGVLGQFCLRLSLENCSK